jgi:hypothetical protein
MAGVSHDLIAQLSESDSSQTPLKRIGLDGKHRKVPQRRAADRQQSESRSPSRAEPAQSQTAETALPVGGHAELAVMPKSVAPGSAPVTKLPYVWGISVNSLLLTSLGILEGAGLRESPLYKQLSEASALVADLTVVPRCGLNEPLATDLLAD